MSSVFSAYYSGDKVTDGQLDTICASSWSSGGDEWVSVQMTVPSGMAVGYVLVYNRAESYLQSMLSGYEVWLGSAAGQQSYACSGPNTIAAAVGPFATWCGGAPAGLTYTTVVLRAVTSKMLSFAELEVYGTSARSPSPPALPISP